SSQRLIRAVCPELIACARRERADELELATRCLEQQFGHHRLATRSPHAHPLGSGQRERNGANRCREYIRRQEHVRAWAFADLAALSPQLGRAWAALEAVLQRVRYAGGAQAGRFREPCTRC